MASSLDDETQQHSINPHSSPQYSASSQLSPEQPSIARPYGNRRILPPSSPVGESSLAFVQEQLDQSRLAPAEEDESLRESLIDRGVQAVQTGNLLRVGAATSSTRPGWSALAPTSQFTDPGGDGLMQEIDELDPSSPVPPGSPRAPQPEEETANISTPGSSPPPAPPTRPPSTRKRKDIPTPAASTVTTPSKSTIPQKPISAHSPARLRMADTAKPPTRSSRASSSFLPAAPVAGPSRSRSAKKQKVVEEEPDSFAGPVPVRSVTPSRFFDKMFSPKGPGKGLQIPPEMRSSDGRSRLSEAEEDEDDEDEEGDQVAGKKVVSLDKGVARAGVGRIGTETRQSPRAKRSLSRTVSRLSSGSNARQNAKRPISPEAAAADTSTESRPLFSPRSPPLVPASSEPSGSMPNKPHSPKIPSPPAQNHEELSLISRPRRGFTNVGMSLSQNDSPNSASARPDRRELFSSQGDLSQLDASQSQSQGWANFPPTQVRAVLPSQDESLEGDQGRTNGEGEGEEQTQLVSDESHARAMEVVAARRQREEEARRHQEEEAAAALEMPAGQRVPEVETQRTSEGGTQKSSVGDGSQRGTQGDAMVLEQTQQVAPESLERAQAAWKARKDEERERQRENERLNRLAQRRSPAPPEESAQSSHRGETQLMTFQTRRSDEEPTQIVSDASQQRAVELRRADGTGQRPTPEPVAEQQVNHRVPPSRQLRRRNVQETRSAPQPAPSPAIVPQIAVGVASGRSRTDPVASATPARLPTPPAPPAAPATVPAVAALRTSGRLPRRAQNSPLVEIQVETGSPNVQGPSSSMQEAEDLLQLGVITQASEPARSPSRSCSLSRPIQTPSRRAKRPRLVQTSSSSDSPPAPEHRGKRAKIAPALPPARSGMSVDENPPPAAEADESAATDEDAESVPSLPQPTKLPTPVKTYGTRRNGASVTPAKPPPKPVRPMVEIPTKEKRLSKPSRRATEAAEAETVRTPKPAKSGGKKRKAAADDEEGSPDPLGSVIDEDEGPARDDRMEVDEPPEPASQPTPQDTEDYSYRPVIKRVSGASVTSKPGKKSAPNSEASSKAKKAPAPAAAVEKPARKVFSAVNRFPSSNLSRNNSGTGGAVSDTDNSKVVKTVEKGAGKKAAAKKADEEMSELSEPESPPTPQDPDDETFKLSKKAAPAKPLISDKKRLSRQASVASTSLSTSPSKGKAPAKAKKRNSKLSVLADDPPLPTPTYTSQRSTTEQDEDEDDVTDRPTVFAYYGPNQSYYPAHVVARVGDLYRVRYLDGDSAHVALDEMRRCELRVGDRVKFDMPSMKKRIDLEIAADWAEGDGKVSVKGKKGDVGMHDVGEVRFARATVLKLFDDRLVSAETFSDLPEEEADESDVELAKRSSASVVFKTKTGTTTFSDKIFLITPTDETTAHLRNTITRNGGQLCDWTDLFEGTEFGHPLRADLGRVPFFISTGDVEGARTGMKVKSMVALCFGVPCLHPGYVEAALSDPNCDWVAHLVSPGTSAITQQAASQIVDLAWGTESWSIRNARHMRRPLANKRILFMNLNPKAVDLKKIVGTCAFGLGAISFDTISTLEGVKDGTYDILILNSAEKDRRKKDLPKGVSGNKKACDVLWLKQCMVSAACPPLKLSGYS